MATILGKPITDPVFDLAEGVLWDDQTGLLRWVDIWNGRVLSGELIGARVHQTSDLGLGQTTGAVALAEDGGLLVAAARGLATVSSTGVISFGPDLLMDRVGVRLNDGTVDAHGAFIVGSLTIGVAAGDEKLLRVTPGGQVDILRENVQLSNGVAFAPDGRTIYHVDTLAHTVSRHSYRWASFDDAEPWVTILDEKHLPAYPDGLTVDSTGALWVAQWGGGSVRRHAPTGELLDVVTVDAHQVSSAAFIGHHLDRLAITSAQEGIDILTDEAGALFVADVDASGLPTHRWAGSTTTPYWLRPERDSP